MFDVVVMLKLYQQQPRLYVAQVFFPVNSYLNGYDLDRFRHNRGSPQSGFRLHGVLPLPQSS